MKEDSFTQVQAQARVQTSSLELTSPDYCTLGPRAQNQSGQGVPANLQHLSIADVPGQYADEDTAQGERLLKRQIEALDAQRHPDKKYKSLAEEEAGVRALTEAPKSADPAPDKRGEGGTIPELMVGP